MNGRRTDPATAVSRETDHDTALDLTHVPGTLEDFPRPASRAVVDELATFGTARPIDATAWAHWLADHLCDQVVTLRAATRIATARHGEDEPTPTADLP